MAMIKLITFITCILCCVLVVNAQDEALPVDQNGKFIYYEVVELKAIHRDSLQTRAVNFLQHRSGLKLRSLADTALEASGKFVIQKNLSLISHPSGEILFIFRSEFKSGKYRFWMRGFTFIPYQRDRYGNFVAASSTGIPLEDPGKRWSKAQQNEQNHQTALYVQDLAEKFKMAMKNPFPNAVKQPERKIVDKQW